MRAKDIKVGVEYAFKTACYSSTIRVRVTGPAEAIEVLVGGGLRSRQTKAFPVKVIKIKGDGGVPHLALHLEHARKTTGLLNWDLVSTGRLHAEPRNLVSTWADYEADRAAKRRKALAEAEARSESRAAVAKVVEGLAFYSIIAEARDGGVFVRTATAERLLDMLADAKEDQS